MRPLLKNLRPARPGRRARRRDRVSRAPARRPDPTCGCLRRTDARRRSSSRRSTKTAPSISADGRFVAYVSDESGRRRGLRDTDVRQGRPRDSLDRRRHRPGVVARRPRALLSSRRRPDQRAGADRAAALVLGERTKLLDLSEYDSGYFHEFDVSADGQRFLVIRTDRVASHAPRRHPQLVRRAAEESELTLQALLSPKPEPVLASSISDWSGGCNASAILASCPRRLHRYRDQPRSAPMLWRSRPKIGRTSAS